MQPRCTLCALWCELRLQCVQCQPWKLQQKLSKPLPAAAGRRSPQRARQGTRNLASAFAHPQSLPPHKQCNLTCPAPAAAPSTKSWWQRPRRRRRCPSMSPSWCPASTSREWVVTRAVDGRRGWGCREALLPDACLPFTTCPSVELGTAGCLQTTCCRHACTHQTGAPPLPSPGWPALPRHLPCPVLSCPAVH